MIIGRLFSVAKHLQQVMPCLQAKKGAPLFASESAPDYQLPSRFNSAWWPARGLCLGCVTSGPPQPVRASGKIIYKTTIFSRQDSLLRQYAVQF
jgi:hypothetical protein